MFAGLYAARGYHVVLQSVRGTFGSAGDFEPMANEAADGADTVAWLREQPWFTGRFATIGLSYLGFTQWALLQDPPPELAAAVITVGPHDFGASVWGTGSFAVNDFLGWSDHGCPTRKTRSASGPASASCGLPKGGASGRWGCRWATAARALLGAGAPWFESWVEHRRPDDDPFWERLRCGAALDRVQVPVLLIGGWQDIFLGQTLQQYAAPARAGRRRRAHHRALDAHPDARQGTGHQRPGDRWTGWTPIWAVRPAPRRPSRVRVYVTGQGWRNVADWPPATTERALYLRPGGHLDDTAPTDLKRMAPATFRYDPADPTPTTGGPLLSPERRLPRRQPARARATTCSAFTSATLTHDLCVYGNPVVELAHSSDNPHVDLFVRVSEVDAKGRSRNVSDGYRRLGAAERRPSASNSTGSPTASGPAHASAC